MSIKQKYFLIGFLFGCCFPVGAYTFELLSRDLTLNIESIKLIHAENKLLFMIDSAPLFLGLFALIGGYSKQKVMNILGNLHTQSEQLNSISKSLANCSQYKFKELDDQSEVFSNITQQLNK